MSSIWKELPDSLKRKIRDRIIRELPNAGSIDLSSIMNGFSKMGYDECMKGDEMMRKAISDCIINNYGGEGGRKIRGGAQGVANVIYYMGEMGVRWNEDVSKD